MNYRPLSGKISVIVYIINTSRLILEGPIKSVKSKEITLRKLSITDFVF